VGDHEHVVGQYQHRNVPPDFGPVKVCFEVNQVGKAIPAVEGVVHDVGHEPGVEGRLLQCPVQALALGGVVV
jgi:hypothetical protein